jgi:ubiquitin-conjugating enzyme E2 S
VEVEKSLVRKRLAGEEFEKKKKWEMKRFRRAGGDLKRFNRGDWGARVGVGRL